MIDELRRLIELHYPDTTQIPKFSKLLNQSIVKYRAYDGNYFEYLKAINNDIHEIDANIDLYFSSSLMTGYSLHEFKSAKWKNFTPEQKSYNIEKFGEPIFITRKWLKSKLHKLNLSSHNHYVLKANIYIRIKICIITSRKGTSLFLERNKFITSQFIILALRISTS